MCRMLPEGPTDPSSAPEDMRKDNSFRVDMADLDSLPILHFETLVSLLLAQHRLEIGIVLLDS